MNKVSWQSPSNIALVKYWGKHGIQLPANPSISFTLSTSHTNTHLFWQPKSGANRNVEVLLEGKPVPDFAPKINQFFERIAPQAPFVNDVDVRIETSNSFPHSSGIASSASGMSALALCTLSMGEKMGFATENFFLKASEFARLGSGSASRSVFGPLAIWGKNADVAAASDHFAVPYKKADGIFNTFCDYILLVDKGEKKVSSTAGHGLMNGHPFAEQRFAQAHTNLTKLLGYLQHAEIEKFGALVESEALTLHAMMMTGSPYFMLFKPNTIKIIEEVWAFRNDTKTPLYFTLDAGANVHLLFPAEAEKTVKNFIDTSLVEYCTGGEYLCDRVGHGPKPI